MEMFLLVLSAVAWAVVYADCIRLGINQKTYGMSVFALRKH